MNKTFSLLFICLSVLSCTSEKSRTSSQKLLKLKNEFHVNGFDFPVGKPDAKGYYNAQKFGENNHLGEDWNGTGGGNTDLGDPIYACANGIVVSACNRTEGWGNVIRILHYLPNHDKYEYLESVYAHCDEILIQEGDFVKKGQKIGTIGTNNGQYHAHLHFEIRSFVSWFLGGGHSENTFGFLDPSSFIEENRKH